jgi:hypothetical protein
VFEHHHLDVRGAAHVDVTRSTDSELDQTNVFSRLLSTYVTARNRWNINASLRRDTTRTNDIVDPATIPGITPSPGDLEDPEIGLIRGRDKVAQIQYSQDQNQQALWIESTMARLNFGEVESVIWGLQRMKPASPEAEEEIRKLIGYLKNNAHRINYRSFKRGQYPRGSGGIESANKFICHVRMKRSGAWWYIINSNKCSGCVVLFTMTPLMKSSLVISA